MQYCYALGLVGPEILHFNKLPSNADSGDFKEQ